MIRLQFDKTTNNKTSVLSSLYAFAAKYIYLNITLSLASAIY